MRHQMEAMKQHMDIMQQRVKDAEEKQKSPKNA
jgi:hypothetical protein